MSQTTRVLIVDDVPMVRQSISAIIDRMQDFEVVGEAASGAEALRSIAELDPDLVTLDIVMPGMNGISALKHLMIHHPRPVVMISSLTQDGAELAFDSIRFGAVDFIPKLSRLEETGLERQEDEIITKLRWAAQVQVESLRYIPARPLTSQLPLSETDRGPPARLLAMGAAQGGYASLMRILPGLPESTPMALVVVLYEHARYVDDFVTYLNRFSELSIRRAVDGAPLMPGVCYISAGEDYVTLRHAADGGALLHVHPAPFESQRGSFNRLLYSATDTLADRVTGMVLSGAGDDGAEGLSEVLRVGGEALVQSPATCLVREMADHAIRYSPDGGIRVLNHPLGYLLDAL